ncbi:hypothetical protein DL769_011375 [Monosporascus sp. CRB-8-3]|nr:hypothetical protein DL769_011375 [Monosporascus sp. CRB-8-3]
MAAKQEIDVDVLVIGAGPTGLGTLSYLFDVGGHVIFSHDNYFDDCIDEALTNNSDWYTYQDGWAPYPFQNNITALDTEERARRLEDLIDAALDSRVRDPSDKPKNFDEWNMRNVGHRLNEIFMWAVPTTKIAFVFTRIQMNATWVGERVRRPMSNYWSATSSSVKWPDIGAPCHVPLPSPRRHRRHRIAVAKTLEAKKTRFGEHGTVTKVDAEKKKVYLKDGMVVNYGSLISTMFIDHIAESIGDAQLQQIQLYFIEDNCPFYSATIYSNYSLFNQPNKDAKLPTKQLANGKTPASSGAKPGPYWSIMLEVSESSYKTCQARNAAGGLYSGLVTTNLVEPEEEIVSTYVRRFDRGYPTTSLERNGDLAEALPYLQGKDILSRGHFGAWSFI